MAKDPAFLFYPGDFVNKTQTFTFEEVGIYLRLLILQFNSSTGSIKIEEIKRLLNGSFEDKWTYPISEKFKKDKDGFYNPRLREEIKKRRSYSESRRNNRLNHSKNATKQETYDKDMNNICKSSVKHMEDENEDRNRDINDNEYDVLKLWRDTIQKIPNRVQVEDTELLIKKHGFDIIKNSFRHWARRNNMQWQGFLNNLDNKGNLKPFEKTDNFGKTIIDNSIVHSKQ